MKKLVKCEECGKDFWTGVKKVVRKKGEDLHVCPKCGRKFSKEKLIELGVKLCGTSRDVMVAEKKRSEGFGVIKKLVPEHNLCAKCRNLHSMYKNYIRREKRRVRTIPKEEVAEILRKYVEHAHKKEIKERVAEEKRRERLKEQIEEERRRQKELEEEIEKLRHESKEEEVADELLKKKTQRRRKYKGKHKGRGKTISRV